MTPEQIARYKEACRLAMDAVSFDFVHLDLEALMDLPTWGAIYNQRYCQLNGINPKIGTMIPE